MTEALLIIGLFILFFLFDYFKARNFKKKFHDDDWHPDNDGF